MKEFFSQQLEQIPEVGKTIAQWLQHIGIRSGGQLKGQNAAEFYRRLRKKKTSLVDRCVSYVFRCAVYNASHTKHDPKPLKWWN